MTEKTRSGRDVFRFSLSGLKTMAAYTTAGAVADDRINRAWDEKLKNKQDDRPGADQPPQLASGRFWLSRRHGTT